ncbi:hypothetical protein H6A07_00850 [Olsenella uli]|uniref:hypothetical protein n=1 Tax=Olsenella uli TaxID=133926 RepID=UPI00195D72DA|nr:hypothetical protein [Olsenella uli]MBM6675296.1 hypothetical protein [Olsenella uli]
MGERRHPVVAAGLLGATPLALALPDAAQGLSLVQVVDDAFVSPSAALLVGAVGGAALTGASVAVVSAVRRSRARAREEAPARRPPRHLRVADEAPAAEERPAHGPSHAATSYEQIAENYVGRATFRERMARRAEGVAATLRERMGANMMDGLPVIERADGSVGDVGTTWWRDAVGAGSIIRDSGFAAEADSAIPSDFSVSDRDRLVASASGCRASIADRIAFVDEGAYPERRTLEDLDGNDAWERALRSLDEKIASVAPPQDPIGFIDSVGGPDSLDEPDNMEPNTAFIPFKTPGGHPEVVDTETYVDYLIEDEFSKNSSTAARRSSRRFLRLLEGGTQPTSRHLADTAATRPSYAGKHFSVPCAAEA